MSGLRRESHLSVMSFNIDGFVSSRGEEHRWANRVDLVLETFRRYQADVIACQEAQAGNCNSLQPCLAQYDQYRGVATVDRESSELATYNLVVWRREKLECLETGSFYLSETPNVWSKSWDSGAVRGATWVVLRCRESYCRMLVLNTHLDNVGRRARQESSNVILEQLDRVCGTKQLPVIIMGDFNSRAWAPPGESPRDYTAPVIPDALPPAGDVHAIYIHHGFKDSFEEAGYENALDMNTYHDYCGQRFPPVALRIDWILYRASCQDLALQSFRMIRNQQAGRFPSDHYPIAAEFTVRGSAPWTAD